MEEVALQACIVHARRDANQGRNWNCGCPLCQDARSDSQLVRQILASSQDPLPAPKKGVEVKQSDVGQKKPS